MNISIFDVSGPVMIGPSSSHTAGAATLARFALKIAKKPFKRVSFELHGSFAKTYKGHGTDMALVAGILGFGADDERLSKSFEIAKENGISYSFSETFIEDMHENSVRIIFHHDDGDTTTVLGSSIGGGQIIIRQINDFFVEYSGKISALLIHQRDKTGVVNDVTAVLASYSINIACMKLSRDQKGGNAFCLIETDSQISDSILNGIKELDNIIDVCAINV